MMFLIKRQDTKITELQCALVDAQRIEVPGIMKEDGDGTDS